MRINTKDTKDTKVVQKGFDELSNRVIGRFIEGHECLCPALTSMQIAGVQLGLLITFNNCSPKDDINRYDL